MSIQNSKYGPVHIPDNVSLPDFMLAKCRANASNVAYIESETGRLMTYAELEDNVRRLASTLFAMGLKKGDCVMIISNNHILYSVVMLAAAYIGNIVSLVNYNYTPDELRYLIDEAQPILFVTSSGLFSNVSKAVQGYGKSKAIYTLDDVAGVESVPSLIQKGYANFVSPVQIDSKRDLVALPFSSGTTGRSKGVMLTHYNVIANVIQNICPSLVLGQKTHQTYICFLPMYHIYGLAIINFVGLHQGHTIVMMSKYDLQAYLECIQKYKPTLLHVVPPVALQLAKNPLSRSYDLSSVHTFYCGAAPLGPEVEKEVLKLTGVPHFRQAYGLTETSPNTHMAPLEGYIHGSCGQAVPNTECKIIDPESGQILGPDKDGELLVRGPQVMKGYLNHPEATAITIEQDGFLHTGDIAHYDKDGNYYVVDRLKELIKWKGTQVPPADIEFLLLKHPAVADIAVVGVPDQEAGELPKAYVVVKKGHKVTKQDVIKFVEDNAAPHKRLRGGVEFVQSIPKSPSGKILRRILRQRMAQSKL